MVMNGKGAFSTVMGPSDGLGYFVAVMSAAHGF